MNDKFEKIILRKDDKYWNGMSYSASKDDALVFDATNKWDLLSLPIIAGVESEVVD
jgi:hypothetical protein